MRNLHIAAAVIGLLTALPGWGFAQPTTRTLPAQKDTASQFTQVATQPSSAKSNVTVHATKGVVTFVDANKLVIKRTPQNGREMTFVLNPSTERCGNVKVGSTVAVRYRTEAEQPIATAVTVEHAKVPPFTSPSHQS